LPIPKTDTPKMGEIHFKVMGLPHEEINNDIYISLAFPIGCPKCRATGNDIRKDGHETKLKGHPQKYECKNCGKAFMTHTSLFFQEVTQAVFMLAFNEVTNTRSSVTEVAKRFNMAPTTLHEFVARVRGILVTKVDLVKKILLRENAHSLTLTGLNQAIYMDETFLKIKGSTYYLIVAVNSEGIPLCWKLASSRKGEIIEGVLKEVFQHHGTPKIIITDGNPTYKKVLTHLRYEGIHIIHIHKDKRNRIVIRKCVFEGGSAHYIEELVGLNHDVFATEGTKPVWVLSTQKKIIKRGGKRGRPKGGKNRPKAEIDVSPSVPHQCNSQHQKSPAKKRGPKNVFTEGCVLEIRVNPSQETLEVLAPVIRPSNVDYSLKTDPDPLQVFSLLYPVFHEFKGHYISSNRIENLFSQFDYLFIPRGRRTVASVTNETSTWLLLRQSFSLLSSVVHYTANSFSSRVGLLNLGKLLIPLSVSTS
jgi:transposase-like protein